MLPIWEERASDGGIKDGFRLVYPNVVNDKEMRRKELNEVTMYVGMLRDLKIANSYDDIMIRM